MFNIRDEGELVHPGFNFYPLKSRNIGFIFRIKDKFICIRYSKQVKKIKFDILGWSKPL